MACFRGCAARCAALGTALAGQICPLNLAKGCALSGSRRQAEPQKREESRSERQSRRRTSGGTAAKN